MAPPPLAPRRRHHRAVGQPQPAARELADHRHPLERVPEAAGLVVEHQLVRAIEEAARAEPQVAAPGLALERDHRPAQGAVDDGQLDPAEAVEGHLVPGEDALGIGPRLAVQGDAEDDVVVLEVVGVIGLEPGRVLQGRNAVHPHAAPLDLVEPDARLHPAGEEIGEARVYLAVPEALEEPVVGMRLVGPPPHPPLPCLQVGAEALAGLLLEEADEGEEAGEPPQVGRALQPRHVPDDARVAVAPPVAELLQGVLGLLGLARARLQEEPDVGVLALGRLRGGGGRQGKQEPSHGGRRQQRFRHGVTMHQVNSTDG